MKIEIGESLTRTWLRHCKGCQLAELNWKPSPTWDAKITPRQQEWYADAAATFDEIVLKKNSGIAQFISQAEIDVLGVCFTKGKIEKVIAADIAFHTNGLDYGSKAETEARISKKLFRAALILDIHFPGIPAEIIFLSPKVTPGTAAGVVKAEQQIQSFFQARCSHFQFRAIINADFKSIVLDGVTPLQTQIADTSELYLRAAQLVSLFNNDSPKPPAKTKTPATISNYQSKASLPIEYVPSDPKEFKRLLLQNGATIYEHYADGTTKERSWTPSRMTEKSEVAKNLRSRSRYRAKARHRSGITKLTVKITGY